MAKPRSVATQPENRAQMAPAPADSSAAFDLQKYEEIPVVATCNPLVGDLLLEPPSAEEPQTAAPSSSEPKPPVAPETSAAPAVPEQTQDKWRTDPRFKDKTPDDVFDSLKNAEQLNGRMGDELGRYRKMFDQKILEGATPKEAAKEVEQETGRKLSEEDRTKLVNEMLLEPDKFVNRILTDAEQRVVNRLSNAAKETTVQQAFQKHATTLNNPDFQKWLVATVPQNVFNVAAQDPAALDYIVNQFSATSKPQEVTKPAERRIPVGTAQGIRSQGSPSVSPVIFSRYELSKLMDKDPQKYAALQPEIIKAYQEGRVKD